MRAKRNRFKSQPLSLFTMNKIVKTTATPLIVALGLSAGHAWAEIRLNSAAITQSNCEARFVRSNKSAKKTPVPINSYAALNVQELAVDDWPPEVQKILDTLNTQQFDDGKLTVIDCVGPSDDVQLRTRDFSLDHLNRQGSEQRGWRFNSEAENADQKILSLIRVELPPNTAWRVNEKGDGLIVAHTIYHPLSNDAGKWFNRIRITEVKKRRGGLIVTQHTTTDNLFDERKTWTLN